MFLHAITQIDFVLASCMFSLFALMNSGYIIRKFIHGKPACSSDFSLKDVYKET